MGTVFALGEGLGGGDGADLSSAGVDFGVGDSR